MAVSVCCRWYDKRSKGAEAWPKRLPFLDTYAIHLELATMPWAINHFPHKTRTIPGPFSPLTCRLPQYPCVSLGSSSNPCNRPCRPPRPRVVPSMRTPLTWRLQPMAGPRLHSLVIACHCLATLPWSPPCPPGLRAAGSWIAGDKRHLLAA